MIASRAPPRRAAARRRAFNALFGDEVVAVAASAAPGWPGSRPTEGTGARRVDGALAAGGAAAGRRRLAARQARDRQRHRGPRRGVPVVVVVLYLVLGAVALGRSARCSSAASPASARRSCSACARICSTTSRRSRCATSRSSGRAGSSPGSRATSTRVSEVLSRGPPDARLEHRPAAGRDRSALFVIDWRLGAAAMVDPAAGPDPDALVPASLARRLQLEVRNTIAA